MTRSFMHAIKSAILLYLIAKMMMIYETKSFKHQERFKLKLTRLQTLQVFIGNSIIVRKT